MYEVDITPEGLRHLVGTTRRLPPAMIGEVPGLACRLLEGPERRFDLARQQVQVEVVGVLGVERMEPEAFPP